MNRRDFIRSAAVAFAGCALPSPASAAPTPPAGSVPLPYDWNAAPPMDTRAHFVSWMQENRGEAANYLGQRFDRFRWMVSIRDLLSDRDKRAFLMTPREEFCLRVNLLHVYDIDFLDIGFGVTISGPGLVGRMTSSIDVKRGDKVLEIGTGSGYQSAMLSNLTDKVWSIEIIEPLFERTRRTYDLLIARGYSEFAAITTKHADGYYGWPEAGPFDKVIVTCGIDHIPPPLLQQLAPEGVMVIPIGPPGAQHVLKVVKHVAADRSITVARSDIYNGHIIPFVPFTSLVGDVIKGTHNGN
jgi:protein-L-isoaspartate(D-aspartate) O-methyltransferase